MAWAVGGTPSVESVQASHPPDQVTLNASDAIRRAEVPTVILGSGALGPIQSGDAIITPGGMEMKWKILAVVVLISLAVGIIAERAVTKTQIRAIHDIRVEQAAGGIVAIEGKVSYASDNRFALDDGTGKAELSTCPTWYKRIDMVEGDKAVVVGQVMGSRPLLRGCRFALCVYKIQHGGATTEVRRGPGVPPWFGYRRALTASAR